MLKYQCEHVKNYGVISKDYVSVVQTIVGFTFYRFQINNKYI